MARSLKVVHTDDLIKMIVKDKFDNSFGFGRLSVRFNHCYAPAERTVTGGVSGPRKEYDGSAPESRGEVSDAGVVAHNRRRA